MLRSLLLCCFLLLSVGCWAQETEDGTAPVDTASKARVMSAIELESEPWYYDLSEAMVNPEQVVKLSLQGQKLKSFPLEVLMFPNLQVLNLSKNKIDTLPPEIGTLVYLQELNLMGNKLKKLPPEIVNLQNMHTLLLAKNRLYMFPPQMRGLQNLRYLDLSLNDFMIYEIRWIEDVLPKCEVKY